MVIPDIDVGTPAITWSVTVVSSVPGVMGLLASWCSLCLNKSLLDINVPGMLYAFGNTIDGKMPISRRQRAVTREYFS